MKRNFVAVMMVVASFSAFAADDAVQPLNVQPPVRPLYLNTVACPANFAMSYRMQCDPGTRVMTQENWGAIVPGHAMCRVIFEGCKPLIGVNIVPVLGGNIPQEHAVRWAFLGGELVSVSFGMCKTLDECR